ncbi:interleukin-11 receptor subunit alpha isoform X3 [Dermochelys coriacea]|uniref:interleukin-11 receptor subunit alpha isoform X3 n=1 Tax=Dermochelys coriacea TaxID=27794 RepID=UPI0018E85CBC|nr:interleukin-11 receptor subunit alpha isoform X3 [Dermochelys coriacea]XP_043371152.1 interleukin-11 receptor subunit alpha isoform X3 [Dermochelys coriacea]
MCTPTPGLRSVMVLLAAALVSTSVTSGEGWREEGVQYGQVGADVVLSCAGAPGRSGVEWWRDGAAALPEGCILRDGDLLLPQAELAAGGDYSCHDGTGQLLCSVSLRLGYLPGIPSVTCRASDYENFSCSWTPSVETFLPTRYITTYRRTQTSQVGPCVQDPGRPHTCSVHKCEFWSSYRLNVTEVNPLGSSFRLLDVTMQAIIKPDPPEGLVVEPVPSAPRRLRVRWQYPASWPKQPHFQLKFRLQYRPVAHGSWSMVETVNLSEVITDAFSGLEHVVQVGAKDFLDAGNWSEWSAEARATPGPGLTVTPGDEAITNAGLESPAEMPSLAPNPEPIDRSDPMEKVAILISLGIFSFFILALVLGITIAVWLRLRKPSKDETKKHDFLAAAVHMRALPKPQIL